MGQGASQPEQRQQHHHHHQQATSTQQAGPSRRRSVFRRLVADETDNSERVESRPHRRRNSTNRLSQILQSSSGDDDSQQNQGNDAPRERPSTLQRSRTTLRNVFGRREASSDGDSNRPSTARALIGQRSSYIHRRTHPRDESSNYLLPDVDRSTLGLNFTSASASASSDADPVPRPSHSASHRSRHSLRFNPLRSTDRAGPFRTLTSSLRRRRSSPRRRNSTWTERPNAMEDQAAMLSRLLSVAAAATAATLMGDDHQAVSEARSLTGGGTGVGVGDAQGAGEDGTFDGFLRALQNGRIASALRQGSGEGGEGEGAQQAGPLNFFRMFRFGASAQTRRDEGQSPSQPSDNAAGPASESEEGTNATDGRMVPIIIVGIRSISPNAAGANASTEDLPPFIDALGSFPSPLPANTMGGAHQDSIDSILRPPQNGTSFRHRRRASMGGFGMGRSRISERLDDRLDNQRDHRSPDRRRQRPWSMASSDMRAPPVTPATASPELSRISSRNSTPFHSRPTSLVANSMRDFAGVDSRRNSVLHRSSAASPLSSHTEETVSLHSTHSSTNLMSGESGRQRRSHRRSDTAPNIHYPRFASGHPRRNGVVEPDNLPSLSRTSTSNATDSSNTNGERRGSGNDSRSWIIYVLGGSYPENHPILTTPSLFTENPTYEDMMLLSALLGPAKAPVASEEDVEQAGGVYTIEIDAARTAHEVERATAELRGEEPIDNFKNPSSSEAEPAPSLKPPYVNPMADATKTARLVALATTEGIEERFPLELGQRCLVCLCDFEEKETARRLVKCEHLFHKECIDQWLTQGRNSCPLCRGQGVDEKEKVAATTTQEEADAAAENDVEAGAQDTSSRDRSRSRAESFASALPSPQLAEQGGDGPVAQAVGMDGRYG